MPDFIIALSPGDLFALIVLVLVLAVLVLGSVFCLAVYAINKATEYIMGRHLL